MTTFIAYQQDICPLVGNINRTFTNFIGQVTDVRRQSEPLKHGVSTVHSKSDTEG